MVKSYIGKRRKRYGKYKKKSYNSRLMDKRINTGVEVRMKEVAKKEMASKFVWIKPKQLIANSVFTWHSHGPYLRVPYASMLALNAAFMWHLELSDFGKKIKNQQNLTTGHSDLLDNYVRVKSLRNRLEFRHQNPIPCKIKIWMVYVSGANLLSAQATVPSIDMMPGGGTNGLYAFHTATKREELPYNYRILFKKTIVLPAARLHTPAIAVGYNGAIEVPANAPLSFGGNIVVPPSAYPIDNPIAFEKTANTNPQIYRSTANSELLVNNSYLAGSGLVTAGDFSYGTQVLTEPTKVVFANEYFKGDGRKFQVQYSDDYPKTGKIFLCVVGDAAFVMTCVSSSTFRLEGPQDSAQPGN